MMRGGRRRKQHGGYAGEAESCPGHVPLHDVRKGERTTSTAAQESDLSTVPAPATLTISCCPGTVRRCDSRFWVKFRESRRSQRRLESARLLDCEGSTGAVAGANARASLAFSWPMA